MKSIMSADKKCYFCGTTQNLEVHHVMNGPMRKESERWGGIVYLCANCHRLKPYSVHLDPSRAKMLKASFQKNFELLYGKKLWMETFKKNYL